MRPIKCALVMVAAAALSGCLSADTLIKVNADGTGSLEQSVLISQGAVGMLGAMGQMGGEPGAPPPSIDQMFSETSLREAAGRLGQGVRYVSSQPAETPGMKGVKAVYAFDDVTKLRVNESPSMPGMGGSQAESPRAPITFDLKRQAGGAALTITMPQRDQAAPAQTPERPDAPSEIPPEAMGMMQMMLKGMKVSVGVQVSGRIVRTDAAHHSDTTVTLLEVDMDSLLQDPEALQMLQGKLRPGASPEEIQAVLRGVKGVKLSGPIVNIEWR